MNRTLRCCLSLALWMWSLTTRRSFVSSFVTTKSRISVSCRAMSSTSSMPNIAGNLEYVQAKVLASCEAAGRSPDTVRLVAVSKTKPLSYIQEAYFQSGQKVFGENYAQELEEKAAEMATDENYRGDIQWHFIGGLQSNKAAKLVKNVLPHGKLVVETVNSEKVANKLHNAMVTHFDESEDALDVFVQVNTSGEDSKSGVSLEESVQLCQHIRENCPRLNLKGVMTIGAPGDVECLEKLGSCREMVAKALGIEDPLDLELSMGMSGDFEAAIAKGSTNVRVGSTIFGERDYSNKN